MSDDDKKPPLTIEHVRNMSEEEVNENWTEVSKVLSEQGKVKAEADDA